MTLTGYAVEGLGNNPRVHACPDCADELNLEADGRRVKEITTSQYRHGNGGGSCVICGFDTLDCLSGRAIDGKTPRDRVKHADPADNLDAYADLIDAATDAFVAIKPAPGVDNEPTEHQVGPAAKFVEHGDIDETLIIEFRREATDEPRTDDCETLVELLEDTPVNAAVIEDNRDDERSDAVHCAIP